MLRLISSLTALALIATPALAQTQSNADDGAPTAWVRYDDLNLSTASGLDALNGRVRVAARQLCGSPDLQDLGRSMRADACFRTAVQSARGQIATAAAKDTPIKLAVRRPVSVRGGE